MLIVIWVQPASFPIPLALSVESPGHIPLLQVIHLFR